MPGRIAIGCCPCPGGGPDDPPYTDQDQWCAKLLSVRFDSAIYFPAGPIQDGVDFLTEAANLYNMDLVPPGTLRTLLFRQSTDPLSPYAIGNDNLGVCDGTTQRMHAIIAAGQYIPSGSFANANVSRLVVLGGPTLTPCRVLYAPTGLLECETTQLVLDETVAPVGPTFSTSTSNRTLKIVWPGWTQPPADVDACCPGVAP